MKKERKETLVRLLREELKEAQDWVKVLEYSIDYYLSDGEIWKDVLGYEGLYEVSNKGQVRNIKWLKRKPLAQGDSRKKYAYKIVRLCKGNIKKMKLVHRLVAQAFIPNPDKKETVNHKDLNKFNNHSSNLEWCTQKENVHHYLRLK